MKWLHVFFGILLLSAAGASGRGWEGPQSADARMNSSVLVDTPRFAIPLTVVEHGLFSYGLDFGIYPGATSGIDPSLGELEYPPLSPSGQPMWQTVGGNAILDLRPFTSSSQTDTFTVGFAAGDSDVYPVTYSWPSLTPYYSGPVKLQGTVDGTPVDVDMKAQNSFTLSTGPFGFAPPFGFATVSLHIFASGPIASGNLLPVVSTYGVVSDSFLAVVHTNGASMAPRSIFGTNAATTVWFDYGPTRSYGTSTATQGVPDGSNLNVTSPFSPSSLPLNTRIHFRAVAQNSNGTFYGGDRIVSNGNPAPEVEDTTHYRTATYRDWADAKDQKNKRKSVKCKPDKAEFIAGIRCPADNMTQLTIEFTSAVLLDSSHLFPPGGVSLDVSPLPTAVSVADGKNKKWNITWTSPLMTGDSAHIHGWSVGGKPQKVSKYTWGTPPGKKLKDAAMTNTLRLPMPNLHNVGEDIFGGVMQTPVQIIVGIASAPNSVYLPKYKDVLKSMIKEQKGGGLYHTNPPRCLDVFDKNQRPISKPQKGLPPDKHNNKLFAEQLTLKLNLAASDSGSFPPGLGSLIFDNHVVKGTPGPFDGMTIRAIADSVDAYLSCRGIVAGTADSSEFFKVDSLINAAFAGPMDTVSWSCDQVICTGVRTVADVPYLLPNPAAQPVIRFARAPMNRINEPSAYALRQNYPNPFNPSTTIEFNLPGEALVTVKVYNILGEEVATLASREQFDEGENELEFDGSNLSSGVYFYRIMVENPEGGGMLFNSVKKMLLVK